MGALRLAAVRIIGVRDERQTPMATQMPFAGRVGEVSPANDLPDVASANERRIVERHLERRPSCTRDVEAAKVLPLSTRELLPMRGMLACVLRPREHDEVADPCVVLPVVLVVDDLVITARTNVVHEVPPHELMEGRNGDAGVALEEPRVRRPKDDFFFDMPISKFTVGGKAQLGSRGTRPRSGRGPPPPATPRALPPTVRGLGLSLPPWAWLSTSESRNPAGEGIGLDRCHAARDPHRPKGSHASRSALRGVLGSVSR